MSTYKLFISQPMRGKTDEQILSERERAVEVATKQIKSKYGNDAEIEVINSFFEDAPEGAKPLWYLGKSFELLSEADVVFFVNGWNWYRGCLMEHQAAKDYLFPDGAIIIAENEGSISVSSKE